MSNENNIDKLLKQILNGQKSFSEKINNVMDFYFTNPLVTEEKIKQFLNESIKMLFKNLVLESNIYNNIINNYVGKHLYWADYKINYKMDLMYRIFIKFELIEPIMETINNFSSIYNQPFSNNNDLETYNYYTSEIYNSMRFFINQNKDLYFKSSNSKTNKYFLFNNIPIYEQLFKENDFFQNIINHDKFFVVFFNFLFFIKYAFNIIVSFKNNIQIRPIYFFKKNGNEKYCHVNKYTCMICKNVFFSCSNCENLPKRFCCRLNMLFSLEKEKYAREFLMQNPHAKFIDYKNFDNEFNKSLEKLENLAYDLKDFFYELDSLIQISKNGVFRFENAKQKSFNY